MEISLEFIQSIGNNREYLEKVIAQLRDGPGLTPFVGAGMSAQLKLPDWGEFLINIARRFHVEQEVRQLLNAGKYEEAAEVCIKGSGQGGLQYAITEEFSDKKLDQAERESKTLRLIAELANGPVVTTNFDHALEITFRRARKEFREKWWGARATAMIEAFHQNRRDLFKIHGNVGDPDQRILTREEYDRNYGEIGKPESKALPLHRVIEIAMENRPLLFLGCSLKSDRIVGFLKEFYAVYQRLMHYAVVWCSGDSHRQPGRRARADVRRARRAPGSPFLHRPWSGSGPLLLPACVRPLVHDSHAEAGCACEREAAAAAREAPRQHRPAQSRSREDGPHGGRLSVVPCPNDRF